jgi:hypothetical protein
MKNRTAENLISCFMIELGHDEKKFQNVTPSRV